MDGTVIKSADEINNFETLKKVADDIQAKKDDLGVDGAFTSAGFDSSSDWRFKTHLANLPIYYEYKEDGITSTDAIKGPILTTSRTCLTFILQILPVSQAFFPARLSMMQMLNLVLERLCSIRMEPGLMITSKITK